MYNPTNTRILVPEFDYVQPTTVETVLSQLAQNGKKAQLIAGGTDLLVQMKMERKTPACLIDLTHVPELRGIILKDDGLTAGASTSIRSLANAEGVRHRYTALAEACDAFSTVQVMIMGTIGGNLCNASPAADTAPALLVFDASVDLVSREGKRTVPLHEFFVGPGKTVLRDGEIMVSVQLAKTAKRTGSAFIKITRVVADIAKVSAAVKLVRDHDRIVDCRIALGAVAPTPMRARGAEECLTGRQFDLKAVEEAAGVVEQEMRPITDVRATKEYRRRVSRVIVTDALKSAWERAGGGRLE